MIKEDIQKEYLDKTLTIEPFPFLENVSMATVHPCKHANVLKSMSDTMRENGQKVESHFALLIFLKFIASVIPTVEFDMTGDLHFKWGNMRNVIQNGCREKEDKKFMKTKMMLYVFE